jgi:hypothetical protein
MSCGEICQTTPWRYAPPPSLKGELFGSLHQPSPRRKPGSTTYHKLDSGPGLKSVGVTTFRRNDDSGASQSFSSPKLRRNPRVRTSK